MNYQDGSYIKVRNISLGYNFTSKQLKNVGLNNLKVYVQAMNPFTIYKSFVTGWILICLTMIITLKHLVLQQL